MTKSEDHKSWTVIRDAIAGRRSTRAFLPTDISLNVVTEILEGASRAPSGGNLQPWKVHVICGENKKYLADKLKAAFSDKNYKPKDQYHYYPKIWRAPFDTRRRKVGEQLYEALDIGKRDIKAMRAHKADNFNFFGAPVGLIFTLSSHLEQGSWLDMGMYLANVMTLARTKGLDTCPQASFISYHSVIREVLSLSDDELLVCGMALGFADREHPVNSFLTERQSLDQFVTVHENLSSRSPEELVTRIERLARQKPEKNAFIQDGKATNRRELVMMMGQACEGIQIVSPFGTRVGIQLPNSAKFCQIFAPIFGWCEGRSKPSSL